MAKEDGQFKPGNSMWVMEKLGALEYWTEDKIKIEIDSLAEWAKRDDSICMAGWCAEQTISTRVLYYLRDKSPVFREAHDIVKKIVANRLAGKLGTKVHQAHYNKYQSFYDSEIGDHEKNLMLTRAQAQDERDKLLLEESKTSQKQLYDQLASLSDLKIAESSKSAEQKS